MGAAPVVAAPAVHHAYAAPAIHHTAAIATPALAVASPAIAGAYAAPATSAAIAVRGYGTPATVGANIPYGYAASGHYRADSVGAVHIAKRSADPFYGHGYGHGYGYGYAGPVATGVSTVPHAG